MSAARQPRAHGDAVLAARFRERHEDFVVEEIAGFEPSGQGEHLLLTIEKRGLNTAEVARRLAAWAGVRDVAIGYAGLKDRHAVTRQRFSVHLPGRDAPDTASLEGEGLRVLSSARHSRKLPRGALAGNRFELLLREVQGDREAIAGRLEAISRDGVPNYFGEQRFGRAGDNVEQALAMFAGRRVRREERSLLLSAARSELFNRVLAARVAEGSWNTGLEGEVWMLDGRRSVFGPESPTPELQARCAGFDIHPTGPLWGRGEPRTQGGCRGLEDAILAAGDAPALRAGLEAAGLEQERRALRMRPAALAWQWEADGLRLAFELPPGAYATTVLAELGDLESGRVHRSS
ncbi:tRNA pseudouridine(13) synthase TruD [Lysobacter sp. N42]|uniref:tRNA pseudouridine(13) synthase TruD n=1 Tax=Lysobacter sp. N42 TaxID=2545719 RepID=UPI0010491994|nr:tRNA pseudouridine(13) synthase TruD [Lysobacter sp. N42]TCZ85368.1 tRNA pseudouridine(13) synthase TruD [Lysobacter sp. N42]